MPYVSFRSHETSLKRERPWVIAGGSALAAVAGFINVCLLGFFTVPVSHMTGAVSLLSIELGSGLGNEASMILVIILGFLVGAVLSGLIIGSGHLMPGRRYGVALVVEGLLLLAATVFLLTGSSVGVLLAAMACGVQNAMASSYYGLVVRTTHLTGIVTDIGVMVGHWIRDKSMQGWKLFMLLSLLVSFFVGGFVAPLAIKLFGMGALSIPAVGCLLAGGTYYAWRHRRPITRSRPGRVATED